MSGTIHRITHDTLAKLKAEYEHLTTVGLSLIHISEPRDGLLSRMPSSA